MTTPLARHRALLSLVETATSANRAADASPPTDPQVAAVMRLGEVLRRLPLPSPPPGLHAPAFLEGILERTTAASAREIGAPFLRAAFQPAMAERDVAWVEAASSPTMEYGLRRPAPRAPGWLWARIRADLESARPIRTRLSWTWIAAAAALVAVGLFAARDGTPRPVELVFHSVDRPITAIGHPSDLIRDLGR